MPSTTRLAFVLADAALDCEPASIARALGCARPNEFQFRALYAGPCRSELRMAELMSQWLWLPVQAAPQLASGTFVFEDEPPVEACPAGRAALQLVDRHAGASVAIVLKRAHCAQVERDTRTLVDDGCLSLSHVVEAEHDAVRVLTVHNHGPGLASLGLELDAGIRTFLEECGAGQLPHPGGTLLRHLQRTAQRLRSWGASRNLTAAGLCHATYGTDGFERTLLSLDARCRLAALIGADAEAIVYLHASLDRASGQPTLGRPHIRDRFTGRMVPLTPETVRDLAMLSCANELDVLVHAAQLSATAQQAIARLLQSCLPLLTRSAADAVGSELHRLTST